MTATSRSRRPASTPALLWAAVLLLAGGSLAQDDGAALEGPPLPESASVATGQGVVASVNGVPITSTDVAYMSQQLIGSKAADDDTLQFVRRQIAEQILLATESERLGVTMTDAQVLDFWRQRSAPDFNFEAVAEELGTTVERLKSLARRRALADIYLTHRVGLRGDWGHRIKPDPELQRWVSVTPKDLRDYFKENRSELDEPPMVHYAVYPCPGPEAARTVIAALSTGELPTGRRPVRETIPISEIDEWFVFSPELIAFLHTASPGAISEPYISEDGTLVIQLLERTEGSVAEFSQVQGELRRRLQASLLNRARQALVDELVRAAVFWPAKLFDRQEPQRSRPPPRQP